MMKEHEFTINGKTYKMRELTWDEDLTLQEQCTDQTGHLKMKELSIMRVAKSLVEPKMLTDDVRQLPSQIGAFLIAKWFAINDVPLFLGNQQTENTTPT